MLSPIDVQCPTCRVVSGEQCVVMRFDGSQQAEVVVHPLRRLPGSPHMARRRQARVQAAAS
jgi:hypothetical protein